MDNRIYSGHLLPRRLSLGAAPGRWHGIRIALDHSGTPYVVGLDQAI